MAKTQAPPGDLAGWTGDGQERRRSAEQKELEKPRRVLNLLDLEWYPNKKTRRKTLNHYKVFEDVAVLYRHHERRTPVYRLFPPPPKSRPQGRRWRNNPIKTALEIKAEMDAEPGTHQGIIAKRRGVAATRICQLLRLLDLPEAIVDAFVDPKEETRVAQISEKELRDLLPLSRDKAVDRFSDLLSGAIARDGYP